MCSYVGGFLYIESPGESPPHHLPPPTYLEALHRLWLCTANPIPNFSLSSSTKPFFCQHWPIKIAQGDGGAFIQ